MHYKLPSYISGHVAAFVGVVALHGGLAAWQMMPAPAVVTPQQQVIHISMVAPSVPPPLPTPVIEAMPLPSTPPKPKGMKKVQPEVKKAQPKKEIVQKQVPAPVVSNAEVADATPQHVTVTEPVAADYLRNPPPVYPRIALRKRMQGTVMIDVRVGVNGLPLEVSLERSSGYAMLDNAALEAVQKWKFVPAQRGSEVVEAGVIVPVEFRIN